MTDGVVVHEVAASRIQRLTKSVATYFGHVMAAIGGNTAGPGAPIKVRRPSAYNPSRAATLGPSQPNSVLNLVTIGLIVGSVHGLEGLDHIFVGGLPYYFTETTLRAL
ncbi:hypothetical protein F2P56_011256 [Juglans regia]|uniref:Uncharacterized protein n=1 Tax=Juglans regia TaxID=51240 RepID=A0A834CZH9_JUGRE|nr:hypothetical protein F2P56_011256 [Juglans regia]